MGATQHVVEGGVGVSVVQQEAAAPHGGIGWSDRVLLLGATGCGKSTVARRMVETVSGPLTVIDPADSQLTVLPGCRRVYGPREDLDDATLARQVRSRLTEADNAADGRVIRYVPGDPGRAAEYDAVYRWLFECRYPGYVWLDEAASGAPASGTPRWVRTVLQQGRKRQLGHLACHTRPRDISRDLIAQAQWLLLWSLPNPDDVQHVASIAGIPPADLAERMRRLPRHGFLVWSQRDATLTACAPIDV